MKKILLWLWQLPQNIAGFIMTRHAKGIKSYDCNDGEEVLVYYTSNCFGCGVSLGNYIILDYTKYYSGDHSWTVNHEHGHQKQSRMLGWFYLLVVGVVSAFANNLWDRLFHKKWSSEKRYKWYYSRYPEAWADKLGGVERW